MERVRSISSKFLNSSTKLFHALNFTGSNMVESLTPRITRFPSSPKISRNLLYSIFTSWFWRWVNWHCSYARANQTIQKSHLRSDRCSSGWSECCEWKPWCSTCLNKQTNSTSCRGTPEAVIWCSCYWSFKRRSGWTGSFNRPWKNKRFYWPCFWHSWAGA